jgi:hypothetical protein
MRETMKKIAGLPKGCQNDTAYFSDRIVTVKMKLKCFVKQGVSMCHIISA